MSKVWDSIAPANRRPDNGLGVTSKIAELEAELLVFRNHNKRLAEERDELHCEIWFMTPDEAPADHQDTLEEVKKMRGIEKKYNKLTGGRL